ncbi:hypothetical protein [Roseiconus lacunae]|uniref:hypothetical protein n=1 Tax=Roseiconus lacunae TaxID=2605694 RepID=UPI001E2DE250|nr:hypothetical protein [Roseiconus lacunae]MCD0462031.1 hypothetical protein [Roseiconus lacunae]
MRIASILFAILIVFVGCGRRGPLDDASLDVLSRTGMHGADVTYPDGYQASLVPDDYNQMRNLISALAPIRSAVEGDLDDFDYELVYIAGMDPAVIRVKLNDDTQFTYKWGEYVYTGGDPSRFQEAVDAIRNRVEELGGERTQAEESGEP